MVLVDSRVDHRHLNSPPVDALLPEPVRPYKLSGRDILFRRKLLRGIGSKGLIRRRGVLGSGEGRRQSRLILVQPGFLCPPGLLETGAAVKVDSSYPIISGQIGDSLTCRLPRQAGYEAVTILNGQARLLRQSGKIMICIGTEHDYDGNLLFFSLPHHLRQSRIYLISSAG